MAFKKKRSQEIFAQKVFEISVELKMISARKVHRMINWSDFIEQYAEGIKKLKDLFEAEGMGGL